MIFCPNFSNKQVKAEFLELVDIFEELYPENGENIAYLLWDKTEGEGLGIPQAKPLVKYYGPTMGKTTATKTNKNIVDFDDVVREKIKKLADEKGVSVRQLKIQSPPEYKKLLLNSIEEWRSNEENIGKTLVVSNAAISSENIYDNVPSIPSKEEFVRRQIERGEGSSEEAGLYYDDLLSKWNPNLKVEDRFVSEIEGNISETRKRLIIEKAKWILSDNNDELYDIISESEYIQMLNELELSRESAETFIDNFYKKILKVKPRYKVDENSPNFSWYYSNTERLIYPNDYNRLEKLTNVIFGYPVFFDWDSKENFIKQVDEELNNWSTKLLEQINTKNNSGELYSDRQRILKKIDLLKRYLRNANILNKDEIEFVYLYLDSYGIKYTEKLKIGYRIKKLKDSLYEIDQKIRLNNYRYYSKIIAAKNRIVALNIIYNIKDIIKNRLLDEYNSFQVKPESYLKKILPVLPLAKKIRNAINSSEQGRAGAFIDLEQQIDISYDDLYKRIIQFDKSFENLVKLFKSANPELKIKIGGDPEFSLFGSVPGKFSPNTNTLYLFNGCDIYTTIHELAHSATYYGIVGHSEGNDPFENKITQFMDYVREYINKNQLSPSLFCPSEIMGISAPALIYGFTNPSEFIAELFGNILFLELLDEIPPMDNNEFNSLLEELLDYIINLFNKYFNKSKLQKSALDQARILGLLCIHLQQKHINDIYDQLNDIWQQQNILSDQPYILNNIENQQYFILKEEKDGYIKTVLYQNKDISLDQLELNAIKAENDWIEARLNLILGETQLQLARAFGLTLQEDGSWQTELKDGISKLRVEFVNSMKNPGSIDFATHSDRVHSLILIGLNKGDASTFNHELAHYYIRTFWNSKAVQDALDMVYVKEMGDYKNDPEARKAVEEALVDYMTQQTVDNSFLTDIESDNFFHKFWESFNKMLYDLFNIKTRTAKNAILNQIVKSFLINEELLDNKKDVKFVMHQGIMNQTEYLKRKVRNNDKALYKQLSRSKFESTVNKIVEAIQSKAKSYSLQSRNDNTGVYGNEVLIAYNNESVRIVKQFVKNIEAARSIKDDTKEYTLKIELLNSFLDRATVEINNVLSMLYNARANQRFLKLMYNVSNTGEIKYQDSLGNPITSVNATSNTKERAYTWDDLQYAKNDIVGFFLSTIRNIYDVANDAIAYNISQTEALNIIDVINNEQLIQKIQKVEDLYKEARRTKCLEWIDQTVDSYEDLDDDFKNRLRINMRKWLDEQIDFGDVSVFEVYIGMGSRSKSPIIRAFQDKIAEMQQERDEKVHRKGLELRDQLAKARKEAGIKYSKLGYNIQKLLLLLNKYGLPTGNLIKMYNDGLYHLDLENFKNQLLFGKGGVEDQLKKLKDSSGNLICSNNNGQPWKLMLNEFGNPIIPDHPLCHPIEKEYMRLIELFKCEREERRFTEKYYMDRIDFLSIPTLRELSNILARMDEIKNSVTINEKFRPDLLTDQQLVLLKTIEEERQQLSSIYNLDGSLKTPGSREAIIAEELAEWHVNCKDKIKYTIDWASYSESFSHAKDKNKFLRMFAKYQINPIIWEFVELHALQYDKSDPDYILWKKLKYLRNKLLAPFRGYEIGVVFWDKLYDDLNSNIKLLKIFKELQYLDQEISHLSEILHNRYAKTGQKYPKGQKEIFRYMMIPYHFVPGVSNWNSISQYSAMMQNVSSKINADPNLTQFEKQLKIGLFRDLLMYYDHEADAMVPLSIFESLIASQGLKTELVGWGTYDSYVILPGSMFSIVDPITSSSEYINKNYDKAKLILGEKGPILKDMYLDKRYLKYFSDTNTELYKLLEIVQDTIKEGYDSISFLGNYDGRAAQIGARTGLILGRKWYNIKRLINNIGTFLAREWEVVETDTDFLELYDYETRPDGTRILNIPIRFIKRLDDPSYISADVVGSAIKLYNMALNYKIKSDNISQLNNILSEVSKAENTINYSRHDSMFNTTQGEVLRGIMSRLVYEDKNSDTNNKTPIIEEPWAHMDFIRKYVISSPASWIKRVRKSRAAFLLGMLALNASSGLISFLDPLISITIDMITGKYVNFIDASYAFEKLFTNGPGNMVSLGSIRQYSKASAAMLKFALSKSMDESFKNMDLSRFMRFIGDGLTMKYFTLGDYTINSMNLIATMHNYKYFKSSDGSIEGFYPKHIWIKMAINDGINSKQARKNYENAMCMWECCEVDEIGDFVPKNDQYGKAITEKTFSQIRKLVRDRSSIYNGVVPDLERSLLQTNVIWCFVTMLRNFFITGIWERFLSYQDFLVASLDENGNPIDTVADILQIKDAEKYQRYYKGFYNLNTRLIEDGVDVSALRWVKQIGPYLNYSMFLLTHPDRRSKYSEEHKLDLKSRNISQTDIYGIQKIFMEFMVFVLLLAASAFTMRIAKDDEYKDNYWIQMLNLIIMRLAIERATWLNPSTALDLISSPTAALSDWKRKLKLFDLFYDAVGLSDHKLDEEMKNGRYLGQMRWKYNLFNGLSSFGLNNWYADMPEELGGGGATSVAEKANFYKGLIKQIPLVGPLIVPSKATKEANKKKSTKSRKSDRKSSRKSDRNRSR